MSIDFKQIIALSTEAFASEDEARKLLQIAEADIAKRLTPERCRVGGRVTHIATFKHTSDSMAEAMYKKIKSLNESQLTMTFNTSREDDPKITFSLWI